MKTELLPCPFCGGMAEQYGEGDTCYAGCAICGAKGSCWCGEEHAAEMWNRRVKK